MQRTEESSERRRLPGSWTCWLTMRAHSIAEWRLRRWLLHSMRHCWSQVNLPTGLVKPYRQIRIGDRQFPGKNAGIALMKQI